MVDRARLQAEAIRVYLRYAQELVEELGLCPWARAARLEGRVALRVVLGTTDCEADGLSALAELGQDDRFDIGLLIFPELPLDRADFARFTATLREADSARLGRGKTLFALADFHPNAEPDTRSAERLIPFIRRSPDPTIQCVRHSALSAVRLGDGQGGTRFVDGNSIDLAALSALQQGPAPLNQRVAAQNLRTLEREGLARVRGLMQDILEDRDRAYAALGVPDPPWRR